MVTISEVQLTPDYAHAKVYFTLLKDGVEEVKQTQEGLNKASGYFRSELAKRHKMRTTPKPRFHYDELMERGLQLESLISKAVRADAEQAHPEEHPGAGDDSIGPADQRAAHGEA